MTIIMNMGKTVPAAVTTIMTEKTMDTIMIMTGMERKAVMTMSITTKDRKDAMTTTIITTGMARKAVIATSTVTTDMGRKAIITAANAAAAMITAMRDIIMQMKYLRAGERRHRRLIRKRR